MSSLDDCYTWSKKPSDDKETLRQKTQESKELAGRYWDWGTSSWLFPLFLSLPTSNLSANAIGYTFKLFPELSGAHCLQHWFKPQHPFSVFFFFFFLFVGLHCQACGILVPWPRIESVFPALAVQRLNKWTTREAPSPLDYCRSLSPALTAVCSPHSNQRDTFQIEVRAWHSFAQTLLLFPIFLGVKALYPLQSLTPSTPHPPSSILPSLCPHPQLYLSRSLCSNDIGLCDLSPFAQQWFECLLYSRHQNVRLKTELKAETNTILSVLMFSHVWLCDPLDCSPSGSSVHGIFQAGILEWVAISFSKGSPQPRDQTQVSCVSCTAGRFFTCWAIREAPSIGCFPVSPSYTSISVLMLFICISLSPALCLAWLIKWTIHVWAEDRKMDRQIN